MFVGVDLGGTNIAAAAGDADGRIVRERSIPTLSHEGPTAVLERVAQLVRDVGGNHLSAVGLGLPGTLDRASGVVRFLPNLPGNWRNVPVGKPLSAALGCPVHLLNDARLAALGELAYGWGQHYRTLVLFTLGTGVGGGVIIDGRLRLGPFGAAGEVGHQTIIPDGPLCGCGNRGCLETLASGPAITFEAIRLMRSGMAPRLHELTAGDASRVSPREVASAAAAGDQHLADALERVAGYLAIAAANLINILHPDLIVLAGGVAAMGEPLLGPLRAAVGRRVGMFPADSVMIERSALEDRAGVLGGIALAARGGEV